MGMMGNNGMMHEQQTDIGKGKARFVELDDATWEEQFAKAGESVEVKETPAVEEMQTAEPETTNLLDRDVTIDASEEDEELMKSLEATWSNLQSTLNQESSISDAEMAAWEAQYGAQIDNINVDGDDGLGIDDFVAQGGNIMWTMENVDGFLRNNTPFPYSTDNHFLDHADPFAEGQRLLAEGAPLSEAALAFEAACRKDETRAEAWRAAGETWAADEREIKGIRALEKAVGCGGPDGVSAWMVRSKASFSRLRTTES
jgi:peroxin-5